MKRFANGVELKQIAFEQQDAMRIRYGQDRRAVIESRAWVAPAARRREQWTHLPDGRWVERIVSTNNGTAYYPAFTNRYVWDGQVLLAVLDDANNLVGSFLRGLDLSGTLEDAGGVGGLLAVHDSSTLNNQPSTHFVCYDGNGNVTALVNVEDGTETARYEYSPFGEPLRMTGPMARANPIRFSTQYSDDVTGDLKYLFCDYDADMGRWPSRDPYGETRDRNLYGFVENNPINRWDLLGNFSEGGEWPPPPNVIDPPPSGPFSQCRIALTCGPVYRYGVYLGEHCGLLVDTGGGVYAVHGSGGTVNSRWVTPGNSADATQPWTDNDLSTCECLFSNVKPWNDRRVPRDNLCANSNWNLKCALNKCKIQVNWGSQSKPIGYDCKECVRWARVGAVPPGAFACDRCLEWKEKLCPDQ